MAILYAPLVHRWVLCHRLHHEDAADIVQEVFTVVLQKLPDFRRDRPGDTFRGWLWEITQNVTRAHLRRRAKAPVAAGGSEAFRHLQQVPSEESDSSADDGYGMLCRRALPLIQVEFESTTWQAFWRVAVEGQRPAEVAIQLGISPNAVYVAKFRVLRRLREVLGEFPPS